MVTSDGHSEEVKLHSYSEEIYTLLCGIRIHKYIRHTQLKSRICEETFL